MLCTSLSCWMRQSQWRSTPVNAPAQRESFVFANWYIIYQPASNDICTVFSQWLCVSLCVCFDCSLRGEKNYIRLWWVRFNAADVRAPFTMCCTETYCWIVAECCRFSSEMSGKMSDALTALLWAIMIDSSSLKRFPHWSPPNAKLGFGSGHGTILHRSILTAYCRL